MVFVILGPSAELHRGIHGGLVDHPPPGVTYLLPPHEHRFGFTGHSPPDPFDAPSLVETIDYGLPTVLRGAVAGVHSSRLPACGGIPWLADTDDLVLTLAYGRPLVRGRQLLPDLDSEAVLRRSRAMCALYAAPQCVGVLLRTDRARQEAAAYLDDLPGLEPDVRDRLMAKLDVVRPGLPPMRRPTAPGPGVSVTYMGRSYTDKGGPVAAAVFEALTRRRGEDLVLNWVGPCPSGVRGALDGVRFRELMPREHFLDLLASTDIFLSPTRYESFGAALAEAVANGCVLLATRGRSMSHLDELYEDGTHGLFVDGGATADRQVRELVRSIEGLVDDRPRMRRMQEANRRLAAVGPLSLRQRDRTIAAAYDRFLQVPREATAAPDAGSWRTFSAEDMSRRYAAYAHGPRRRVVEGGRGTTPGARG